MDTGYKIDFRKTALIILITYTVCITGLFLNSIHFQNIHHVSQVTDLTLILLLIICPQFILFQYVSNFQMRWAQLMCIVLQIVAFIFPMYYHGKVLLLMHTAEEQPIMTLIYIPIWECVIILALGLIYKLIRSY